MTQKKKYYFCFALAISICMTVLIQVFQLYSLPILGILELFYARECMYDRSEYI